MLIFLFTKYRFIYLLFIVFSIKEELKIFFHHFQLIYSFLNIIHMAKSVKN